MVFIHGKKVLHGDLTARNVLLTSSNKDRRHWISQVGRHWGLDVGGAGLGCLPVPSNGTCWWWAGRAATPRGAVEFRGGSCQGGGRLRLLMAAPPKV